MEQTTDSTVQSETEQRDPMIDGVVFLDRNYGRVLLMRDGPDNRPWLFHRPYKGSAWVALREVRMEEIPTFLPGAMFLKQGEAFSEVSNG